MIADAVRMDAYHRALAATIKPGAIVLDIGAGTGIMSLLACKLGAGKVYAVEPSDAVAVGIELARANGCSDRIEFLQASSFDVTLPQPADVMVSDLRSVLPLHRQHIASIVDARRRLLAPGGVQIPLRDTVHAQLVSDDALFQQILGVWRQGPFGLQLAPGLQWAANQCRKVDLSRATLLGQPQALFTLDYRTGVQEHARGEATWTAERNITLHGLAVWFDAVLAEGVELSNAPDRPRAIYGQMFYPFQEPLPLAADDVVALAFAATPVQGEYVWQWHTTVRDGGGRVRREFRQSSFQASPVNPARLDPRAGTFMTTLGREGRAAAHALSLMERRWSVEDIARELLARFPDVFQARPERAREMVGDLSEWFSEGR
jgi:protein arginine N-methyltransferase 1